MVLINYFFQRKQLKKSFNYLARSKLIVSLVWHERHMLQGVMGRRILSSFPSIPAQRFFRHPSHGDLVKDTTGRVKDKKKKNSPTDIASKGVPPSLILYSVKVSTRFKLDHRLNAAF